ncbi:MAG: tetratricopeptide repeat protein, partial [Bdellovibrionales bacterium]|nr:tetratricopeptide repeat protein [Bdellovibrionales bacterium]
RLEAESPATNEQALLTSSTPDSTECVKAGEEVNQAQNASDTADKLFHYRRALRLCPESPAFHLGLGEVYLSLGRSEDAEFEFREALRIDPTFRPAVVQLGSLNQPERY